MSHDSFRIERSIARAETPPAGLYTDPAVYQRIRSDVFARSWQAVASADELKAPGQVLPFVLLEGCLDEPLVLTRDASDRLRCLSNVCTHRGMLVCETAGVHGTMRCRYHGRRFGLDGRFLSMPEFDGADGFPRPAGEDLAGVSLERWGPLLFVSLDPDVPFHELIAPVTERTAHLPLEAARLDPTRSREYLVQANWALYCDNYLEGFHIPYVHAELAKTIDYARYRTELFTHANVQIGFAARGDAVLDRAPVTPEDEAPAAALYFWLFPNTMINVYPWGLSINVVKPLGVERTRVVFLTYVWDPRRLDTGAGAGLDRVEREDEVVVEAVQRGLRSRLYTRGRYSPSRETGVHHFHCLLAERLRTPPPAARGREDPHP